MTTYDPHRRTRRTVPRTALVVLALLALAVGGCNRRITDGDGPSNRPVVSGDGRYVAFDSQATDLVPGDVDTNGTYDVFVFDRVTATTSRISHGEWGSLAPDISADGRFVAYLSWATQWLDAETAVLVNQVFVHDRATGATQQITEGDSDSEAPRISADGRHVMFVSHASNLIPGGVQERSGVYLYDRDSTETVRVTDLVRGADLSADGRFITFATEAADLVPGDTNGVPDVFVHDRTTGGTTRITDGNHGSTEPVISDDGRYVAYESNASDLVPGDTNGQRDVFVFDRASGTTTRITDGDGWSFGPVISGDGGAVAFASLASDLAGGDTNGLTDVFVHDRSTGSTSRITDSNGGWTDPWGLSADGQFVSFQSDASNLAAGDDNGVTDVFIRNRRPLTER